jgi:riboflavin synthase
VGSFRERHGHHGVLLMFTGIVEEMGTVESFGDGHLSVVASKVMESLKLGDSVTVNGACLTATAIREDGFTVDVVPETLRRTNLGELKARDSINLERAALVGGRLDGHIVQGHVDGTGVVAAVIEEAEALMVAVDAPPDLLRYVVQKGFVAVDGTSLTVVDCSDDRFTFTVIPYTRENTVIGFRNPGDRVNIEVDILAKYVERLTAAAR